MQSFPVWRRGPAFPVLFARLLCALGVGLLCAPGPVLAQDGADDLPAAARVLSALEPSDDETMRTAPGADALDRLVALHADIAADPDGWGNALAVVVDGLTRDAAPSVRAACLTHLRLLAETEDRGARFAVASAETPGAPDAGTPIMLADALTDSCLDPGGNVQFAQQHRYTCSSGGSVVRSGSCCTGAGCFFSGGFRCWRVANFCNTLSMEFNQDPAP
jgi:hypothetical protein